MKQSQSLDAAIASLHCITLAMTKYVFKHLECSLCRKYKPKPKPEKRYHWGSKLLPKVLKGKGKNKPSPGQMKLPWDTWEVVDSEVRKVTEQFVLANCYDPKIAMQFFNDA